MMTAERRKPITVATDEGRNLGGWYPHPVEGDRPRGIKLGNGELLVWCCYCGEWTIYKRTREDMSLFRCTGWCKWGNTNDFYIRKYNRLFGEER